MLILAGLIGFAAGVVVWYATTYLVVNAVLRVEGRRPDLAGSWQIRALEAGLSGAVFLACLGLAFYVARLVWLASLK